MNNYSKSYLTLELTLSYSKATKNPLDYLFFFMIASKTSRGFESFKTKWFRHFEHKALRFKVFSQFYTKRFCEWVWERVKFKKLAPESTWELRKLRKFKVIIKGVACKWRDSWNHPSWAFKLKPWCNFKQILKTWKVNFMLRRSLEINFLIKLRRFIWMPPSNKLSSKRWRTIMSKNLFKSSAILWNESTGDIVEWNKRRTKRRVERH